MQLKVRRSQRSAVLGSTIFCIDARAEFTPPEALDIRRYQLEKTVIYNSTASRDALDKADAAFATKTFLGTIKAIGLALWSRAKLNISVGSLQRGQHIECKNLDEVLGVEDALMTACRNLKSYLDAAATFTGLEVVLDFSGGEPTQLAFAEGPKLVTSGSSDALPMASGAPTLTGGGWSPDDHADSTTPPPDNARAQRVLIAIAAVLGIVIIATMLHVPLFIIVVLMAAAFFVGVRYVGP